MAMMPVAEYAKRTGLTEAAVIALIHEGGIVGRVKEGVWFVDFDELAQTARKSIPKDVATYSRLWRWIVDFDEVPDTVIGASGKSEKHDTPDVAMSVAKSGSWYYADDQGKVGPLTLQDLKAKFAGLADHNDVLVWCDRFTEWKRVRDVPELKDQPSTPPPLPPRNRRRESLILAGYLCSAIGLLVLPNLFGAAGFVIAIINSFKGRVGHGITQAILAVVCIVLGL